MIDRLLAIIAPHYCYGCGQAGGILCHRCKYDILDEPISTCFECGNLLSGSNVCMNCCPPYSRVWCVGSRVGVLEEVINAYKYEYVRDAHKILGDMLTECVPDIPAGAVVVPLPTIQRHVRQRGYDHTLLLARRFARSKGLSVQRALQRCAHEVQVGASRKQRIAQAKRAFVGVGELSAPLYILVDDVATTGASVRYGAQALRDAGAKEVWVATIAKQPLD